MTESRAQFATKLGVIATTVGSAVGLGNIWRFPYEAGMHGGGAFLIIYLFIIFVVGIPVITAEFIIGRHTGSNIAGAFHKLARNRSWSWVGYIGLTSSLMILSFYSVVAGWTLEYIYQSIIGFSGMHTQEALHTQFDAFSTSNWRPLMWTIIFLTLNLWILLRGVQKGIERMSNIMMPALFLILIIFCINSLTMSGAKEGLTFLFRPDFSKIDSSVLMGAMGQAFFSLSLGLGCLITYSSYFNRQTRLVRSASIIAGLDTMVAILAGVIIFPAIFTYGLQPEAGPKLVFEILPSIFIDLPGGMIWSTLFFILLFFASITSTISMSEISIAYFVEEKNMSRRKATWLNYFIAVVFGSLCALSFGSLNHIQLCGKTIFDLFDFISSNILLPIGGMAISIFVGWVLDKSIVRNEVTNYGKVSVRTLGAIVFCLKYIAPICIALVFLCGLGVL